MPRFGPAATLDANPLPSSAPSVVLVVDDDRMVRDVIVRSLRKQNYEVLEAASAEAALVQLGTHTGRVGALITDETMPGMSGRELASVVAKVYPRMGIVLMSGYGDERGRSVEHGSAQILAKPFSLTGLLDAVEQALARDLD